MCPSWRERRWQSQGIPAAVAAILARSACAAVAAILARSACADRQYSGTTGLVPVDRRLAARSVSLITCIAATGLVQACPRGATIAGLTVKSWLHGDKPRGGRPMPWIVSGHQSL